MTKCVCSNFRCAWQGQAEKLLSAPDPFIPGETLYACPKCKTIDSVVQACDEEGCWKEATCGTPTPPRLPTNLWKASA